LQGKRPEEGKRAMATSFQGTTTKCTACDKTVYLVDKLTADNRVYHKACFRCHHCKGTLKVQYSLSHHTEPTQFAKLSS